ncbi:MAG: heme ABC exporter ATP-binding protein CcmA [Anaerolineae bacterium]|nr:heme ABC exporter ATP-binding protein CcmA [Anaerolineae bacterium]
MTETSPPIKALIQSRALNKAYDLRLVLRQLDIDVLSGECVALLGANGSGKSTLLRLFAGMSKPTSGELTIGGWDMPREAAAVRAQIGMVSHKPLLYDNLSARENLRFFARLYNVDTAVREERIARLLDKVGLAKRADDRVRAFSRGMQQRLSIARALVHQPAVLLFDEPYTGLDQEGAATLDTLIAQARDDGHTIVVTTHELERVPRIAGRALILSRGRVGYDAPLTGTSSQELVAIYTDVTGMTRERER